MTSTSIKRQVAQCYCPRQTIIFIDNINTTRFIRVILVNPLCLYTCRFRGYKNLSWSNGIALYCLCFLQIKRIIIHQKSSNINDAQVWLIRKHIPASWVWGVV